jgi:hypothetical protein
MPDTISVGGARVPSDIAVAAMAETFFHACKREVRCAGVQSKRLIADVVRSAAWCQFNFSDAARADIWFRM